MDDKDRCKMKKRKRERNEEKKNMPYTYTVHEGEKTSPWETDARRTMGELRRIIGVIKG